MERLMDKISGDYVEVQPVHSSATSRRGSTAVYLPATDIITNDIHHQRNYLTPGGSTSYLNTNQDLVPRRPSFLLQEILTTRRPSAIMAALTTRPSHQLQIHQPQRHRVPMGHIQEGVTSDNNSNFNHMANGGAHSDMALDAKRKNRRIGDDALSTALSALYCKLLVILGVAMPVTEILSSKIPSNVYQGFYVYLYLGSIAFVFFQYATNCRKRAVFNLLKSYQEKANNYPIKKRAPHFGSFYLRVGAIAFGIGAMVYSGLELGQYFELRGKEGCTDILKALTPATRMFLAIVQMQFIFLNTTQLDMAKHKVISRFGLMHMVATNLCEWLYVLVEETKHEIFHLAHSHTTDTLNFLKSTVAPNITEAITTTTEINLNLTTTAAEMLTKVISKRSAEFSQDYIECQRTNIMGTLVQNASPFLYPCTIEYSLICAVIAYEMWKQVKSLPQIERSRRNSEKHHKEAKSAHHFSIDCSRAHRGMFAGILVIVLTIIALIMYFVLHDKPSYELLAIEEVTICEIVLYSVTAGAVVAAMFKMRDLKFQKKPADSHHASSVSLDCTLLVLAQTGVYVYAMFSIMGCYFSMHEDIPGGGDGLFAETLCLLQTSIQTIFILNTCWRRCKGQQQNRRKPGREIVTFLLVANMAMWFINCLIKGRASFRPTHLHFFGVWAWTVITHVSMPLAIFYRFHSTICLFEIWKSAYKVKNDH